VNSHSTGIQPNTTDSSGQNNQEAIDERQKCLGRSAEPFALVHEKPENTRDTICEPTCENTGYDTEEIVEIGDAVEVLVRERGKRDVGSRER
jgi:hypothetical protein